MTAPTPEFVSPPAAWYSDPDGSGGQRYWDGEHWTKHRRPDPAVPRSRVAALAAGGRHAWAGLPMVWRLTLPIVMVLILIGVGFILWTESPRDDDWARLPNHLNCQLQDGPKPPDAITVASVAVAHPRTSVLELVVRFVQPLPQSPTGSHAVGFVGYVLDYSVANNGKKFVELGPEEGTDDLSINSTEATGGDASMRPDRDTNARRIAPDTMQIMLELRRLGVDNQRVVPELTLASQFNTPSTTTVEFAKQVCR